MLHFSKSKIMFLVKSEQTAISQLLDIKNLVLRNVFDLFLLNIDACSTSMQPCDIAFDLMLKFGELHTVSAYNLSVQK